MNVFEAAKVAVPLRKAAECYGLQILPNGMACCPFHEDRHPSLKLNEDYFFCFGCGAHGDVIDFTAGLFNLSLQDAAEKLTNDFGIGTTQGLCVRPAPPNTTSGLKQLCIRVLSDYLRLLQIWRLRYAPVTLGSDLDERFAESIRMESMIDFFLDTLVTGDAVQRDRVLRAFQNGTIYELRDYVEKRKKEENGYYQEDKIA